MDDRPPYNAPFAEQVEFFRRKLNLPTKKWTDIVHEEHDRAFVVAGAQSADLLADLNAAVASFIEDGKSIDEFRREFREIVARHGWTGWKGEGTRQGFAWRTRVIYETNMATSYAAGRFRQLSDPDLLAVLPYWRYQHADSVLYPRPLHVAWDGLTLLPTHHFWLTHFPPNGWGCHCCVEAVSEEEYRAAVAEQKGPDAAPPEGDVSGVDKGFRYTPGRSVADEVGRIAADKVARLPEEIARAFAEATERTGRTVPVLRSIDDWIAAGRAISESIIDKNGGLTADSPRAIALALAEAVGTSTPCKISSRGQGAAIVREASRGFPDSWTAAADDLGPLYVKAAATRAVYVPIPVDMRSGVRAQVPQFGVVDLIPGSGFMLVRTGDVVVATHELAHRIQSALPRLQELFDRFHDRRTAGETLQPLRDVTGNPGYRPSELCKKDAYIDAYFGKEYPGEKDGRALELFAMTMQIVLGAGSQMAAGSRRSAIDFETLYTQDRELFDFVIGVLFHWRPK